MKNDVELPPWIVRNDQRESLSGVSSPGCRSCGHVYAHGQKCEEMKVNQKVLLVDVDGVLANLIDGIIRSLKDKDGIERRHDDVTQYNIMKSFGVSSSNFSIMKEKGFCAGLKPYDHAVALVERLRSIGYVHFITTPTESDYWHAERTTWLVKHFGAHPVNDITFTERKDFFRGAVIVDDKPEVIAEWKKVNPYGLAILWAAPYNTDAQRVETVARSHEEAFELVRRHIGDGK